ncbi:ferritin-like domain-containing protein [Streptomyces griseoluteus]|uniref:ferritin-like domain-containing protein n=1 Tax=Streptomyces griseoluteus TaxID=29306 RepID=UPI00341EFD56
MTEDTTVAEPKRRTLLTTAAAAAGASAFVAASPPASAATGAAAEARLPGTVARLLAVPAAGRGAAWLRSALQIAVELELSTIPPYLCAWWSVKDRRSDAARLIRRVIDDEMYHLGVACNLLVAVGGRPRIRAGAPTYPGPLPGGVHPGLTVYLSGLSRTFVHDVMMAIEAPDVPLSSDRGTSPSVGDFYTAVLEGFRMSSPQLSTRGQLETRIGSDDLRPVRTLLDVERAIDVVREQGEGTGSSPADSFADDHPAHYYAFSEIYHGRQLRETDRGWTFTGSRVPFPETRPMARVPAHGWSRPPAPVGRLLHRFDTTYTTVLTSLDAAWAGGGLRAMGAAIHAMRGLEEPALHLMETRIPGRRSTYGPQFHALS